MLRRRIKQNAKNALSENWSKAVTILLFMAGVWLLLTLLEALIHTATGTALFEDALGTPYRYWDDNINISPVSIAVVCVMTALSFIIGSPLKLGVKGWFYTLSEGKSIGLLPAFAFFSDRKRFGRSLLLSLALGIRKLFFSLIFLAVPCALLILGISLLPPPNQADALIATVLILSGTMLFAVGALLCSIFLNRYFLVPYLVADGETKISAAIRRSVSYMKGNKVELFILNLSFLPWWLLCIAVLPVLYAGPYFMASHAVFARYAVYYGIRDEARSKAPGGTMEFGANNTAFASDQAAQTSSGAVDDMTQEYKFVPRHMLISDDDAPDIHNGI